MAMAQAPLDQGMASIQQDPSLALRRHVLSLYSLATNTDEVISTVYRSRCKFVDPIVSTRGQREVKAHFRSLKVIFRQCKAELASSHYDVASRTLTMDTTMVFKPKLWPFSAFRIRNFSVVVVGDNGLVKSHTDHWSAASLLETKLGWAYNVGRRALGAVSSVMIGWLTKDSSPRMITAGSAAGSTAATARASSKSD